MFRRPPGGIMYGVDPVEKVELASGEEEAPVSAEEKNKALVRRYFEEVWVKGNSTTSSPKVTGWRSAGPFAAPTWATG
jgi:hypothetical protein